MKLFKGGGKGTPGPIKPKSPVDQVKEELKGPFPEELFITRDFHINCVLDPSVAYEVRKEFSPNMVTCTGENTRVGVYKLVRVDEYKRVVVKAHGD